MNLITRLIGLNILIFMLWGAAALGGNASIFLDIPSIVMVLGVLFGGVLLCFPVNQIADAFGAAARAEAAPPVSGWRREQRIAVFARLYQLAWGGGLVGGLVALIAMLSDLSDPASIGSGMAAALLAPAYGALLAEFIFNPMQQMVMNQPPLNDDPSEGEKRLRHPSPVPPRGQTALFKGVAVVAIIVSMFMVPIVSFSEIKRQDAFDPATEAIYLRYLYGDDAPNSQAVNPHLSEPSMKPSPYQPEGAVSGSQELSFQALVEQRIKEMENERANNEYYPGLSPSERLEAIRLRQERIQRNEND